MLECRKCRVSEIPFNEDKATRLLKAIMASTTNSVLQRQTPTAALLKIGMIRTTKVTMASPFHKAACRI